MAVHLKDALHVAVPWNVALCHALLRQVMLALAGLSFSCVVVGIAVSVGAVAMITCSLAC